MALTGSPKKKSSGPFKTLKRSILRNKTQYSQISLKGTESIKTGNENRKSIQRITLFRHDYVKVRSWQSNSSDTVNVISNKASLEIYEIYMINSKQRMNYLSLGKQDQFVHPILPKLKVQRVRQKSGTPNEFKIIISLFNPERFWEVTFLPQTGDHVTQSIINEFQRVMENICVYTDTTETHSLPELSKLDEKLEDDDGADNDADNDDLEYLLMDESSDADVLEDNDSAYSDECSTLSANSLEHILVESEHLINATFKHALGRIKPVDSEIRNNSSRYKRFSSMHTSFINETSSAQDDVHFSKNNRRSISFPVPLSYDTGRDFNKANKAIGASWMDINFEDIAEI